MILVIIIIMIGWMGGWVDVADWGQTGFLLFLFCFCFCFEFLVQQIS